MPAVRSGRQRKKASSRSRRSGIRKRHVLCHSKRTASRLPKISSRARQRSTPNNIRSAALEACGESRCLRQRPPAAYRGAGLWPHHEGGLAWTGAHNEAARGRSRFTIGSPGVSKFLRSPGSAAVVPVNPTWTDAEPTPNASPDSRRRWWAGVWLVTVWPAPKDVRLTGLIFRDKTSVGGFLQPAEADGTRTCSVRPVATLQLGHRPPARRDRG